MLYMRHLIGRLLGVGSKEDVSTRLLERVAVSFVSNMARNVDGEVEVTYQTVYLSSVKRVEMIRLLRGLVESVFERYQDVLTEVRSSTDLVDHLIGSLCSKIWEMEPEDIKDDKGVPVSPAVLLEDAHIASRDGLTAVDSPAIGWGESTLPGVLIDLHSGVLAVGQPNREGGARQGVSAMQWDLHDASARYQASETLAEMAGEGITYWRPEKSVPL